MELYRTYSGSRQKEKEINYENVKSKKLNAYNLCVLCVLCGKKINLFVSSVA
jgi:hypothetical protein